MLNLAFLSYFIIFWWTIYDFPVKKDPDPGSLSSQIMGTKWFAVLTTAVTILLAHTRSFTRLILIFDPAPVRFALGADPALKNICQGVCWKKRNPLYVRGKYSIRVWAKKLFYTNQINHTPSPLKVKWLTPKGSVIGHRSDYDGLRTNRNGPWDFNKPPHNP